MNLLARTILAGQLEAKKPETYVKGDQFEEFVRKHLFTRNDYDLLAKTHDYTTNENDFILSSTDPDFKFRARKNGSVFFVEAKFKSGYYDGAIEWCKPHQLNRYAAINREVPVYVVIGVGNMPSAPAHVFLLPIKRISRYLRLFRTFLAEYEIPGNRTVSAEKLVELTSDS